MHKQSTIAYSTPLKPEVMLGITMRMAHYFNMSTSPIAQDDLRILDYDELLPLNSNAEVYVHLKKEHADFLMNSGTIRLGTLRSFRESESEHARDTNEGAILTWIVNTDYSYLDVGAIGDNNHVYCTSLTPHKNERLKKFGESTVRIKAPYRFLQLVSEHIEMIPVRLGKVMYTPLNSIQLKTGKEYGIPNALEAPGPDQLKAQIALAFLKRPEFSLEQECRFMWVSKSGRKVESQLYHIPQITPLLERIA